MHLMLCHSLGKRQMLSGKVHDISIPLRFNQTQPNHFAAEPAQAEAMRSGEFVGDTRLGGSCNAVSIKMNPHCNGTHTECIGHLTTDRVSIHEVCPALPMLAILVSVTPTPISVYNPGEQPTLVITKKSLEPVFEEKSNNGGGNTASALIIRTLPNAQDKITKVYRSNEDTPYMSTEAAEFVVEHQIEHLLVDIPSIDPYHDAGRLAAHRVFFGLPRYDEAPQVNQTQATRGFATITEMIFVPDDVSDGQYLLNLQIPAFELDAAPSRPLLYELDASR